MYRRQSSPWLTPHASRVLLPALVILVGFVQTGFAQDRGDEDFAETFGEDLIAKPRMARADYDIEVTLDDHRKHLTGEMVVTWRNPADHPVEELWFHLYANAFQNARSTFNRESLRGQSSGDKGLDPEPVEWSEDDGWGWVRILRMQTGEVDITDRIQFVQPDDGNRDDQSVVVVPLPIPVEPGGAIAVRMEFDSRIPRCEVRSGWWQKDFLLMAHWFPKLGVFEPPGMRYMPADEAEGRWNCHQFHAATEFYSDFGVYDVRITLPMKYVVGTSGTILEELPVASGMKRVHARAESVHEFAWAADAQFREAMEIWRSPSGREVTIRLLYQPDHTDAVRNFLDAVQHTLDYVEQWLGPDAYPYPIITVIDPRYRSGAGGMEYPNLITGGARWWAEQVFGDGIRLVEAVTVHEFMHQFWYGLVANNEFEESGLDEGFTTYSEGRILEDRFGKGATLVDWWGFRAGQDAMRRFFYVGSQSRNDGAIHDPTFAHWRAGVGFGLSYNKTSLMLSTLENHLGRERFDAVMRAYFQRWRFRHPSWDDFVAVAGEVSGEELDWFFDQLLDGRSSLDYAVASIANVPVEAYADGLGDHAPRALAAESHQDGDAEESAGESEDTESNEQKEYDSTVVFRRVGEVVFPMETLVEFADGEIVRDRWDGRDRVKVSRFQRPAKVIHAAVDPDYRVPLDVDRLNNSLRLEEDDQLVTKYTLKGFFWMQSLLQFFAVAG